MIKTKSFRHLWTRLLFCDAEDYVNVDNDLQTEADVKGIDELVENHKRSQEKNNDANDSDEEEVEEEIAKCPLKTYQDALKYIKELQEFSLKHNDSDLLNVICRAHMIAETQAANKIHVQKTILYFWQKWM